MEEYKKSYKGFVAMLLVLVVLMFVTGLLPTEDVKVITLLIFNIAVVWMAFLTWVIYKTEKIYWYTGLTYEDAVKVSSDSRKEYALRHFKRFAVFAVIYLVYSVISYIMQLPLAIDIGLGTLGIVTVAISTMNIKLR